MPKRFVPVDTWAKKAKKEGWRARSVYKLRELDERFRLIHAGMKVLDLGAAPGSFLQYVSTRIGPRGYALGIDLEEITPIAPNVHTFKGNIQDLKAIQKILEAEGIKKFDLILSDLSPNTSGIKGVDQWRSIELAEAVIEVAKDYLIPGGCVLLKLLRGEDFDAFVKELRRNWESVKLCQVRASRDRSSEMYILLRK